MFMAGNRRSKKKNSPKTFGGPTVVLLAAAWAAPESRNVPRPYTAASNSQTFLSHCFAV